MPLLAVGCSLALALSGCSTLTNREIITGPSFEPTNISSRNAALPEEFRRVALLPLVAGDVEVRRSFQEVLLSELRQAGRFEVVPVSRQELKSWFGRDNWTISDTLPLELMGRLRSRYACDGVMFAEVTHAQVYAPMRIGWRLTLADVNEGKALWAADEVFDATDPAVANGARRFHLSAQRPRNAAPDSRFILLSPTTFARYSVRTLVEALPHANAAKFLPVPADTPNVVRSSQ